MDIAPLPRVQRESASFLATRVGRAVHADLTRSLEPCGLTPNHFTVVSALHEFGALSQADIAARIQANRGHLVGFLDDLEQRGLVVRGTDPRDRRRNLVHLTAQGEQLARRATSAAAESENKIFACLGAEERTQLRSMLTRVLAETGENR